MVQNVIPPGPALWLTALVGNRASRRLWLQVSIRGALGHWGGRLAVATF